MGRLETTQNIHLVRALITLDREDVRGARTALVLARRTLEGHAEDPHGATNFAVSAVQAAAERPEDAAVWLDDGYAFVDDVELVFGEP